jgi:hypothetical protein
MVYAYSHAIFQSHSTTYSSSGSTYDIVISTGNGAKKRAPAAFPWVTQWDEDEGKGTSCASSTIKEEHNATVQQVHWKIGKP